MLLELLFVLVVKFRRHISHLDEAVGFFPFLVLLSFLGASVLEPDLNLPLGQRESLREFSFPSDGDVATVVELFLQLKALMITVDHAVLVLGTSFTLKQKI